MEAGQARPGPDETGWAPQECTLPTTERPLRLAEFDALFGEAVTEVRPAGRGRVRLVLRAEPEVAGRAAELAARETGCCSFFTFTLTATGGALTLDASVADPHVEVLDALAARASETAAGSGRRP